MRVWTRLDLFCICLSRLLLLFCSSFNSSFDKIQLCIRRSARVQTDWMQKVFIGRINIHIVHWLVMTRSEFGFRLQNRNFTASGRGVPERRVRMDINFIIFKQIFVSFHIWAIHPWTRRRPSRRRLRSLHFVWIKYEKWMLSRHHASRSSFVSHAECRCVWNEIAEMNL